MSMTRVEPHTCIARFALLALALVFAPRDAAAQPPAAGPDEAACEGKASGDACTLINGQAGACGPGTCARLDYSQGSPPKSIEEPCTVCKVGAPPLGSSETSTTSGAAGSRAAVDEGAKSASAEGDDDPPKTTSRCSVTERSGTGDLGVASLLLVLLLGSRRRRA
jgi:hypothetical protein